TNAGVGFLRSMDGGRTWRLLDSATNVDAAGNVLPINSGARNHQFLGASGFKVIVDPNPDPSGNVIVYAAMSTGVYRSSDTGGHGTHLRNGTATDVALAAGSAGATGNLQILYAAVQGVGVFFTSNAPATASLVLRSGNSGNAIRRDIDVIPDVALNINNDNV